MFFFPPCSSGFSLYFRFALYFGFAFLYFGFTFDFGLWVLFWEGCLGGLFGFSCRFWGFVGLECFRGRFGYLMDASSVFWALGAMGAPCGVLGLILVGLFGFFFLLWASFGGSCVYSWYT
jgi:hypothetical protein